MALKPTDQPQWADTGDITEPGGAKKANGWDALEKPAHDFFNWWQNLVFQWTTWLTTVLGAAVPTELTIAAGVITPTLSNHSVDTESDASEDDLDNVLTTNMSEGAWLKIFPNAGRAIIVKHEAGGAGQIHLAERQDVRLNDIRYQLILERRGADWHEVSRAFPQRIRSLEKIAPFVGSFLAKTWIAEAAAEANSWRSIAWSPELGLFAAVSNDGTNRVMTSPDGINWTARVAAEANQWLGIVWSPELGLFAAVSFNGTNRVMTSPDGINWTARAAAEANQWEGIAWSPELGLFAAVSIDGANRVMTSPDGIAWTARVASAVTPWIDIAWSPELGLFAAVSNDGANRVMTSPDGIAWTARVAAEANLWRSIVWSPELGLFAAVSTDGTNQVMTSPDGIAWTARVEAEANIWLDITWSPELGFFAAVSIGGTNRVMRTKAPFE